MGCIVPPQPCSFKSQPGQLKKQALPGVLVSKYEEVIENLTQEVKRIAQHLELNLEPTRYQEIASNYTIGHQKSELRNFEKDY